MSILVGHESRLLVEDERRRGEERSVDSIPFILESQLLNSLPHASRSFRSLSTCSFINISKSSFYCHRVFFNHVFKAMPAVSPRQTSSFIHGSDFVVESCISREGEGRRSHKEGRSTGSLPLAGRESVTWHLVLPHFEDPHSW